MSSPSALWSWSMQGGGKSSSKLRAAMRLLCRLEVGTISLTWWWYSSCRLAISLFLIDDQLNYFSYVRTKTRGACILYMCMRVCVGHANHYGKLLVLLVTLIDWFSWLILIRINMSFKYNFYFWKVILFFFLCCLWLSFGIFSSLFSICWCNDRRNNYKRTKP